jgi:alanine-glyoxylate transaminase/serine-glyoxylate transaminase/serine-pyruvate transaminase
MEIQTMPARAPLNPPERILMGPGPSAVTSDVLRALAAPTLGHLDPEYLRIMDETRQMLREVFRTSNEMTLAVSGTGSAGMETCLVNLIEPGDEVIVCVNGVFGGRMADVAERCGARVHRVERQWGEVIEEEDVARAVAEHPASKLFAMVHAETSTGAHQPVERISELVHDAGMLLVLDVVTSLGGAPVEVDSWRVDACYSGTQKCLSCPPGLSPVSFSQAALDAMDRRKSKVQSWYLDVSMLRQYWGAERVYHHTAPVNMTYALRQSLANLLDEGLEQSFARHTRQHRALRAGLEAMGLRYIPARSLPMLNAIHAPSGVDEARLRRRLLDEYGIEVGAGLGPFKGKAIRIGLMGASCTQRNVTLVLSALEALLADEGVLRERGAAREAAAEAWASG